MDLLDLIPAYGLDGKPLAENSWTKLGRLPRKEEIDNCLTTDEMILEGKAILRDGRKVTFNERKS